MWPFVSRVVTVTELDFSVYDRTIYLRVHPLKGDAPHTSSEKDELREVSALFDEGYMTDDEYEEQHKLTLHESDALPDEWMQVNRLRSAIIHTRRRRAGQRLLAQLLVAVAILVVLGLIISGALNWFDV
jgi:hypothetical protein